MASAAAPSARRPAAGAMWITGAVLALSNFMVILDLSIANVSIQHIAGSLAVSPDQSTWVITSYSVSEAIAVPLTGWLAGRFGAVRSYLVAMVGFTIFSVLCGLSVSLPMLIVSRVGQGLCGGPIMPLTQTLLSRVFPPEKRGLALGLWSMTTVIAPVAGPLIGGPISDNWSWHWIFFINLPVAALILAGAWFNLRGYETESVRRPIDVIGLVLLVLWVGSLQIMLDIGRDRDWFGSGLIVALSAIAAIGFVAFVIWELTDEHPIVNLRIFRHRGFTATVIALFFSYGAFFANVVITPQFLQTTLGYTATWSGYATAWMGVLALLLSPPLGRISQQMDARKVAFAGILVMGISIAMRTHWTSGMGYWSIVWPHLLLGVGMSMFFAPMNFIMLGAVRSEEVASAAGLASFMRTISASFGTAIAATSWANMSQIDRAQLAGIVHPSPSTVARLEGAGLMPEQVRGVLERLVSLEGATLALDHFFEIAALVTVLAAFLVWLAPKPRPVPGAGGAGH